MTYKHESAEVRATREWARYERVSAAISANCTAEHLFMSADERAALAQAWDAVKATKEWAAAPGLDSP